MKRDILRGPAALLLAALLLLAPGCGALPASGPAPAPMTPETPAPSPPAAPAEASAPPPAAMAPDGEHPRLVAHAGGAIWGYRYTNSREALDAAWAGGFRFIELDLQRTSDGELVLLHDWEAMCRRLLGREGPLTREEFLCRNTLEGLTLMDLEDLLAWLEGHPGCSVITDVKPEDNGPVLAELREQAGDLADRFIPQAYSFEEAAALSDAGWTRVILTLYRMETDPGQVAAFLEKNPLWAVTVSEARLTEAVAEAVSGSGTALYCHTVNALDFFDEWKDKGLTGIYTDYFQPAHWPEQNQGTWNK